MIRSSLAAVLAASVTSLATACGGGSGSGAGLAGSVQIDGSSTVFPIAEAFAEEFQLLNRDVRVTVGFSGTGGGFKRFCAGEIDLSNASRPITEDEIAACAAAGIDYIELPVAWDGLSVVANPANDFVTCLTTDELHRIWMPGSEVTTWRDVRSQWPDEQIRLYGPGTDSGTFDYFTETINGEAGASRPDYQASEDDNILVQGISGDHYALGYLGYAYYAENTERLKLVEVDSGGGCVTPTDETIEDGSYSPLSRPLYFYVGQAALDRPEVRAFLEFAFEGASALVPTTGYHALAPDEYESALRQVATAAGEAD